MKKWLFILILFILVIAGILFYLSHNGKNTKTIPTVTVKKGTVIEKAEAIGYIEPLHSSTVKSAVDGIVEEIYHDAGDYVHKGEPLLKVNPQPEPAEYAAAYEELQKDIAVEKEGKRNLERFLPALKSGLITKNYADYIDAKRTYETDRENRILAAQKLALLDKGTTRVGKKTIANIVKSPFTGYLLTRDVDVGDPVISLSSAQASTALFTMANMYDLMFEGSVDEMDAAKIHLHMPATVIIGAIPDEKIIGELTKIALQSDQEGTTNSTDTTQQKSVNNNSTNLPFNVGFQVQVTNLKIPPNLILRSGYSATADINVTTAKDVLVLPERVLHFKKNKIYILLPSSKGQKPQQQNVTVGISDGMQAEIKSGVTLGEKVLDKPDVEQE
jgi:HlyD family secretion protein